MLKLAPTKKLAPTTKLALLNPWPEPNLALNHVLTMKFGLLPKAPRAGEAELARMPGRHSGRRPRTRGRRNERPSGQ